MLDSRKARIVIHFKNETSVMSIKTCIQLYKRKKQRCRVATKEDGLSRNLLVLPNHSSGPYHGTSRASTIRNKAARDPHEANSKVTTPST